MAESYWNHIATAYDEVSVYDGADVFSNGLKRFPPDVGDLIAVHWFLSEMSNGGISQFLSNPTRVVGEHAVRGLMNLELPEAAEALRTSLAKAKDSSGIFEAEERVIYAVGGSNLARIYDRMDTYAKAKRANEAVQRTSATPPSLT